MSEPSKRSFEVLLIEDSRDDAMLIEMALREQGYFPEITRVENREALEVALGAHGWDVVLCDHSLPTLDSLAALALVRGRELDVPFIIVSSAIPEAVAVAGMRAGAQDFLFKNKLGRLGAVIDREIREAKIRADGRSLQQQLLLSDRLASVGMLAAGVAHEINNPLAYVLGNLEFALNRLNGLAVQPNSEVHEVIQALTHAREGSERIRATTSDLRVFCRTDDGAKTDVDVRAVMESSINIAATEIRHRGNLRKAFDRVPAVSGNENRLGQVFLNLLVNAAQALPQNHVEEHEVSVQIYQAEDAVVVEVRDTGCGISPENLKRIFEPFFTTKPRGVGSGIGLAVCQSLVTELGGRIDVESEPGKGTAFRVVLPASDVAKSVRPARIDSAVVRRARVLVIDDEPALCSVIRRLLAPGHEVTTFTDPGEAFAQLRRDAAYDVIFCDVMMPGMSGLEFFSRLEKTYPELVRRTVFLTGGASLTHVRQFLGGVRNLRVEKPFEAHALQRAVSRVLEESRDEFTESAIRSAG